MTEQEQIKWIETCIHQENITELKNAESRAEGLEQYKFSVAVRIAEDWIRFQKKRITAEDFSSSLRSYLLVWNTDIALPGFEVKPENLYGLMKDSDTGKIYVNYHTPDYMNEYFLKTAYIGDCKIER